MKRVLSLGIFCVLFLTIGHSQQQESNNAVYLGFGSFMISQEKSDPIKEFSPTIDLVYNRLFDDGFVVGAGYYFKNIIHPEYELVDGIGGDKIRRTENNHAFMVSLGYNIKMDSFSINPYIAAGLGLSTYKPRDYDTENKYDKYLMLHPGVKFGYEFGCWMVFTSYNFDITPQYNHLYHHFNVGLGYLF